ncbi:zinc carboxypeptidase isoform X2 [Eurytemora carolleeae]|uniref:zinc carboxypeptidase isoform X2 n=1 Tax=Eurytemora carolleeae TaxID=1294199 RepID=UPI000C75E08C|nr:zinc carboxypeptidase isoform X2 [Eurytemora carolleeae]|eukprot:XP_023329357.1 zinc carboxypeptidase-like isoform X2 [Eurytemora affinis]
MKILTFVFFIGLSKYGVESKKKFDILNTGRYLKLSEQYEFLKEISELAEDTVQLEVIGNTYIEGKDYQNDIYLVTIGNNSDYVVFFDCGNHAREWISSAVCLYLIQELASVFENADEHSENVMLNYQWQFIPVLNPDGYHLSHVKDRMQRKNGRPVSSMNLTQEQNDACRCDVHPDECSGVDLNRNFPGGFGKGNQRFVRESNLPCFEMYRGAHALSEPETLALDKHISSLDDKVLAAISIHSYGKEIYYPQGWLPDDHKNQIKGENKTLLTDFADAFNEKLKFVVGNAAKLLGEEELEGGGSDDYYYMTKNINLTYTIELDPHMTMLLLSSSPLRRYQT